MRLDLAQWRLEPSAELGKVCFKNRETLFPENGLWLMKLPKRGEVKSQPAGLKVSLELCDGFVKAAGQKNSQTIVVHPDLTG